MAVHPQMWHSVTATSPSSAMALDFIHESTHGSGGASILAVSHLLLPARAVRDSYAWKQCSMQQRIRFFKLNKFNEIAHNSSAETVLHYDSTINKVLRLRVSPPYNEPLANSSGQTSSFACAESVLTPVLKSITPQLSRHRLRTSWPHDSKRPKAKGKRYGHRARFSRTKK